MEFFLPWRQRHRQRQRQRRRRRQRLVIQSIVVAKLSERWVVGVEGGREVAGWEMIAKWSELASSGGWTAGRLATLISIDTCSSGSRDSSRDSDSSRICLHLAISALSLSLLPLRTLPLTSWGDNAAFLTHKNVENQAEIMRTNWATKVVLRRRRRRRSGRRRWWLELAVEVSELGLMNMKMLGEKIAATVWRSQRQRRIPHPPSGVCVCSLCGGGRGRTASHAMACVSFSTTLPSSLPAVSLLPSSTPLLHHATAPAVLTFTHLTFLSPEPGSGWPRARVLKNYMPNRNCMFNISNNKQGQQ